MFRKEDIEAYKSIQAPDTLKERILESCASLAQERTVSTDKPIIHKVPAFLKAKKYLLPAAACFALLVGLMSGMYITYPEATVTYNNVSLYSAETTTDVSVMPRARSSILIPLTVSSEKAADISISSGMIWLVDEEGNPSEMLGVSAKFQGEISIIWIVNYTDETHEITVSNGIKESRYRLDFNGENNTAVLNKE